MDITSYPRIDTVQLSLALGRTLTGTGPAAALAKSSWQRPTPGAGFAQQYCSAACVWPIAGKCISKLIDIPLSAISDPFLQPSSFKQRIDRSLDLSVQRP